MARAVLYLPDAAERRLAALPVAGRPLAVRAIVAAARTGAERVGVPAALRTPALEAALRRIQGLAGRVRWLDGRDPAESRAFACEPCLLVPASALIEARTLASLLASPMEVGGAAIVESAESGAPVLLAPPELVTRLWALLAAGAGLGAALMRHVEETRPKLRPAGGLFVRVTAEADRRDAEAALYASLGTDDDTAVDRLIHRRCSRPITRVLVQTRATPNQVSAASLLIGLGAASGFCQGTPLAAVLGLGLYSLAVVLDHVDGELARLTFQETRFGAALDWTIDTVVLSLVVLAMGLSAGRGPGAVAMGFLGALGVTLSALVARYLPRKIAVGETIGGALKSMGNRDLFYLLLLTFVLLTWALPAALPILVLIIALGSQAYWIACVAKIRRHAALL
ncbi:MAG: CDP-alcohol phosphatidyltransferase family protein [Candidatus Rokubacteria bacterium]|nr:CDP-alcohol phosphatidyltransferase family protein [Candidatus Rokubacteria bacterium]